MIQPLGWKFYVLYHQLVTGRLGFTAFFICLQVEFEEVGIIG